MPTYVYKFVDTGETIEVQQGFHDDTLTEVAHPETGEMMPVKKVFTPVGITFKGSGFFKTDNRGKSSATTPSVGSDASTKSGGSSTSDGGSSTTSTTSTTSGGSATSTGTATASSD